MKTQHRLSSAGVLNSQAIAHYWAVGYLELVHASGWLEHAYARTAQLA